MKGRPVLQKQPKSQAGEGCFSKGHCSIESTLEETTWCPDSRARGLPELSPVGFFYPQMGKITRSTEHGSMWFKAAARQHADQVA